MGLAVELYFDDVAEQAVRALRAELVRDGLPPTLEALNDQPHVSLAVFSGSDPEPLLPQLASFARATSPFRLTLSAFSAFPSAEGVLFLSPTPTEALLRHHRSFHRLLGDHTESLNPYYRPDAWVPHCTLAAGFSPDQMVVAIEICLRAFKPLELTCREVGLISFHPVTLIQAYPLQGA